MPALARPGVGAAVLDMASPAGVSLGFALVPLSLAVALLRFRLWGLDVVVNRALVYAALTASLLALYLAVATGLARSLGAPGDAAGSVFATALVALLFAPLRDRLQRGVDRLMYGQRDEPYRVLSALGQRLEAMSHRPPSCRLSSTASPPRSGRRTSPSPCRATGPPPSRRTRAFRSRRPSSCPWCTGTRRSASGGCPPRRPSTSTPPTAPCSTTSSDRDRALPVLQPLAQQHTSGSSSARNHR